MKAMYHKNGGALTSVAFFHCTSQQMQAGGLATGHKYTFGLVLGFDESTGLYKPCVKTATDGSQEPCAIYTHEQELDLTAATAVAESVDLLFAVGGGWVERDLLVVDATWLADDIAQATMVHKLAQGGIGTRVTVGYGGN